MSRPYRLFHYKDQVWESMKQFYFHHINKMEEGSYVGYTGFSYKVSRGFDPIDSLYKKRRSDYVGNTNVYGVEIEYNGEWFGSKKALWMKLNAEYPKMYAYVSFVVMMKKMSIDDIIERSNRRVIKGIDY